MIKNKIRVMELFAGVGGFRLGLEDANSDLFQTVWANQWEPSRKVQHAFDCYTKNFNSGIHVNEDIADISEEEFQKVNPDLIVGGFPCQDYSVARSLSGEEGIQGKKGVLFWEITRAIESTQPKYVLLENVDRLLKSPSSQRGRDFAVMLATFQHLNYSVEWRVINAADYGFPQRRRRAFIFAYKNDISFEQSQRNITEEEIVFEKGFFAPSFPVQDIAFKNRIDTTTLPDDLVQISDEFSFNFYTAGIMRYGEVYTMQPIPVEKEAITLGEIKLDETEVDSKYYLKPEAEEKFEYLRGAKKVERVSKDGHKYFFSEGGMSVTDSLDKPGRTMLTSEGTINRSSHIIEINNKKRYLTPVECERLNGFPDNWTADLADRMRYFCMGNALVVGLIKIMGQRLEEIEKKVQADDVQLELFPSLDSQEA